MAFSPFTSKYFLSGHASSWAETKRASYHAKVYVDSTEPQDDAPEPKVSFGFHRPTEASTEPRTVAFGLTQGA